MTDDYCYGGPSTPYSKPTHHDGSMKGGKIKVDMSGGKGDVAAMTDYIKGETLGFPDPIGGSISDCTIADGRGAPNMERDEEAKEKD